ncbi:MAG: EAL domain-containing protein, partial [Rugosibacter sp.]
MRAQQVMYHAMTPHHGPVLCPPVASWRSSMHHKQRYICPTMGRHPVQEKYTARRSPNTNFFFRHYTKCANLDAYESRITPMTSAHFFSLRRFATFAVTGMLLTCCAAIIPAALATPAVSNAPLRVVMDDNYPPYVMRDANGSMEGLLIDEWRLWEEKTGIKVDITATDWAKAQQIMLAGGADVIDTIFRTPAREQLYDFSAAYADLPVGIYTHVSIGGIHDLASLRGSLVGVKAGDACIDKLARFGITTLKAYPSYQAVVDAAMADQMRVFCMDEPPANYLLYRAGSAENFRQAFTLYTGQFHRAVHKGDAATLKRISQGFAAISSAEREALRDKWMGKSLPYVVERTMLYGFALAIITILALALFLLLLQRLVRERTAQLAASQSHLQATLDALPDLLFELDGEGCFHDYHSPRTDLLAAPPEVFLGKTVHEILPPAVAHIALEAIQEADIRGYSTGKEYALDLPQGELWFGLSMAKKPIAGKAPHFIALIRDITVRKISEQQLARMTQLYAALSQCNQAIVRCRNEEELFPIICRNAVNFGGFKMAWIGEGDTARERIVPVASYGGGQEYLTDIEISTRADDPTGQGLTGTALRTGEPAWCQDFQNDPRTAPWHERSARFGWSASAALPLTCNGHVVGVFTLYSEKIHSFDEAEQNLLNRMAMDISYALQRFADEKSRQQSAALIEHLANYDPLTGLPNRVLLRDRVHQAIATASRAGQSLALMFLDLDHFKNINDSLGHSMGDDLLRGVAARLLNEVREQDTVSRWGGDEFILMLRDCTAEGAARVAEKLLLAFAMPYQVAQHELNTTPSIGIALYPADGDDFESLAKAADAAMYRAKHEGRNTFRFFTSAMQIRSQRFLELENALRTALKRDEFFLHYQPKFAVEDGRLSGAEALVRWRHPTLGLIAPGEFIAIAELSGQILQLGAWVMKEAIRQAKAWQDEGLQAITLAVNLSAAQFRQSHLVQQIKVMLDEAGLDARYLELELTESLAMEDPQAAIEVIDALHAAGIMLSIDDFGTGYSSLAYLKRFRISKLKIDQSFVRDIASDPNDR